MIYKYLALVALVFSMATVAMAEETVSEKAAAAANKTTDAVKETYRDAKDKVCEMINGEMKCLEQKIKHKAKTVTEKAGTKTKEVLNKID